MRKHSATTPSVSRNQSGCRDGEQSSSRFSPLPSLLHKRPDDIDTGLGRLGLKRREDSKTRAGTEEDRNGRETSTTQHLHGRWGGNLTCEEMRLQYRSCRNALLRMKGGVHTLHRIISPLQQQQRHEIKARPQYKLFNQPARFP